MRKKVAHPNEIQNTSNHIYIFIRSISLVVLILFTVKSLTRNHDENGYAVETFCKIVVLSTDPR